MWNRNAGRCDSKGCLVSELFKDVWVWTDGRTRVRPANGISRKILRQSLLPDGILTFSCGERFNNFRNVCHLFETSKKLRSLSKKRLLVGNHVIKKVKDAQKNCTLIPVGKFWWSGEHLFITWGKRMVLLKGFLWIIISIFIFFSYILCLNFSIQ